MCDVVKKARTFSSSVARSNLRSSRHLLPNSSTISRRCCSSSPPRLTGHCEALFLFRSLYIALFFIRDASSPSRGASSPRANGKKREREKLTLLLLFLSRAFVCVLSFAAAREAVVVACEALEYVVLMWLFSQTNLRLPRVFFRDLFLTETLKHIFCTCSLNFAIASTLVCA